MIELKLIKTSDNHDSDDVQILKDGTQTGRGFLSKDSKRFGLERCGDCGKENYALNVMTGVCTWCGKDFNEEVANALYKGI